MRMAMRPWSARILLLGVAVIGLGILFLFHPTTTTVTGGGVLECGSAVSPSSVADVGYGCSTDGRRFTGVSIVTRGAFVVIVAGLWPALRGAESSPRVRETQRSDR